MPLLSRHVKSPLLSTVKGNPTRPTSQNAAKRRKPLPDIHPDADPITSSDSESDEIQWLSNHTIRSDLESVARTEGSCNLSGRRAQERPSGSAVLRRNLSQSIKVSTLSDLSNVECENSSSCTLEESRVGWKRKRGLSTNSPPCDENEAAFDELCRAKTEKKNKRQYRTRKPCPSVSNVHTASENSVVTHKTIESSEGFKKPGDITESTTQTDKKAFHAPHPLQEIQKKSNKRSSFEAPRGLSLDLSPSLEFSEIHCSSDPFHESSSVLSDSPDPETRSNRECHDSQINGLESLNSPPASTDSSSPDHCIAVCPMCKVKVDSDFLNSFSEGKKLRLTAAMDFCLAHKQRSAENHWALSKYPSIDWHSLDTRLRKFNNQILAILEQRKPSAYRHKLEERVASGQSRNALRNPEAESLQSLKSLTGYYGARGARKMIEHVMAKFAAKIRVLATKDKLFTEVGVSGFVQAVLVPELVLLLVMEDFGGCDKDRAQAIVSESAEMGDLVNKEEEEWVDETTQNKANLTEEGKARPVGRRDWRAKASF